MTEDRPSYKVEGSLEINPAALLPYSDPGYKPPTYEDLRALKAICGLTGGELAKLCGVDSRTFRAWTAPPEASRKQRMPYSAWRLLLINAALIEVELLKK